MRPLHNSHRVQEEWLWRGQWSVTMPSSIHWGTARETLRAWEVFCSKIKEQQPYLCVLNGIGTKLRGCLSSKHGTAVPLHPPLDWPDCMTGDICWLAVDREGWDLNLSRSSVDTGVIKWLWFHPSCGVAKRKTHQNILQVINKWEVFVAPFPSVS